MKNKKRISGFYWVKWHKGDWVVGHYQYRSWWVAGYYDDFNDWDFEKIIETPIPQPK